MHRGFTLLETIIYIAILALLIGGGIAATFYIIDASGKNKTNISTQAEGHFILRKIDWALTGATDVSLNGTTLTVINTGGPYVFSYDGTQYLLLGSNKLNSSLVKVSSVVYTVNVTPPKKITATFTVDGKLFMVTKYLRK